MRPATTSLMGQVRTIERGSKTPVAPVNATATCLW